MRENLPITNQQVDIPEDYRLISRTDLNGTILEANYEFIKISGYSEQELIGQPHNMLRHPDVPALVFKDMWQALKSGKSWTQIVKNRCKDGGHYWVKANASPIIENGKPVGYISVRKPATQSEINAASKAYKMIENHQLVIHDGIISTPGQHRWSKGNPFSKLGIMGKLILPAAILLILGFIASSISAQQGYEKAKIANEKIRFDTLNSRITQKLDALESAGLNTAIGLATNLVIQRSLESNISNEFAKRLLDEKLPMYEKVAKEKFKVHIHNANGTSYLRNWNSKSGDDLTSFRFVINQVIKTKEAATAVELGRTGIAIRSLAPVFGIKNKDDYVGSIEVITPVTAIKNFFQQEGIHYFVVLTPNAVEIANKETNNPKIGQYTLASQTGFDAPELNWFKEINIEDLVKNNYQEGSEHFFASFPIYDARKELVGYQIITEDLKKIGELNEISAENAIATVSKVMLAMTAIIILFLIVVFYNVVRPVKRIVKLINHASETGDLTVRLDDRFNDEMGQLGHAYNNQMQTAQISLGEAGRMIRDISVGNFKTRSSIPMHGDFEVMNQGLNRAVRNIDATFDEVKAILTHIRQGKFTYDSKVQVQGEYKVAMQQALAAMAILRGVFFEVNELMGQVARGFFTRRITAEAEGELKTLKDNINTSLDKLEEAISETTNVMISQGSGDLKARIKLDLEGTLSILKDGINNSITNMGSLMSQSNYSIYKLSEGAKEIAKDISDLSGRTQQQAAAVEQTAASMEEITSTIQQTANNAMDANQMAATSLKEAKEANDVVQKTILSINQINEASTKISEITSLIDSIAFQTNLLALNAAVEAARAGEHGRGFAVVASEVRSLAGKSAEAAKQIRTLIDDTVEKVHQGAALAKDSGQALEVINSSIAQIGGLVSEITKTTAEQAKGVQQVNEAIGSIDQATQQNAALVDETAAVTAEMGRLAENITEVIGTFKIDLNQIAFNTAMETGQFAFANARRAHRQWKGLIRAYVSGMDVHIDKSAATDHTKCGLGLWFYGEEGQRYAHLAEMQAVDKYHAELHATIKQILQANDARDDQTVEQLFHKLDEVSEKVIEHLSTAELAVAQYNKSGSRPSTHKPVAKMTPPIVHTTAKAAAPSSTTKPARAATNQTSKPATVKPKPQSNDSDEWGEF